MIFEKFQLLAS